MFTKSKISNLNGATNEETGNVKPKKKIYKRWWFWVIVVVVVFSAIGGSGGGEAPQNTADTDNVEVNEAKSNTTSSENSQSVVEESELAAPASNEPSVTMGQKNALSKAYDYLDYTAFSRSGLIAQLEYEGFTNEEAVYAADRCGADWNEQAAKKAADYLDYSSFSRDGLIEQLVYEGFSQEQAAYGASAVGY